MLTEQTELISSNRSGIWTESEQNVTLVKNDNFSRVTRQFSNKATDKH